MKNTKRLKKPVFFRVIICLIILFIFIKILDYYGSSDSLPEYPSYEKMVLENYLDMQKIYTGKISKNAENFLYLQTGLTSVGINNLREECGSLAEFVEKLHIYQEQLFSGIEPVQILPLEDGDILVSLSQRFCYYPHGHAAIVVDGEKGEILEAKSYRAGSCIGNVEKWEKMNSFVVLRVKDEVIQDFKGRGEKNPVYEATSYAKENLVGLKYSLMKDIRPLSDTTPQYTQCAHLVWYAYYVSGLDIDENRGFIIKPKDFLKSDTLEIVQVYGISPEKVLKMRNE